MSVKAARKTLVKLTPAHIKAVRKHVDEIDPDLTGKHTFMVV